MQVNELRIGNIIKIKDDVVTLEISDFIRFGECVTFEEDLSGIQLTDKWLFDFGFYLSNKKNRFIHETLDVEIEKQGNYFAVVIWNEECPEISNFILHSQYVHEFQNNIFALTQTELTIK